MTDDILARMDPSDRNSLMDCEVWEIMDDAAAALRAARDREAAMREALDKFTSTVGFDPDSNLHLDAWSIAEAALTDTAAQDWRERVEREALLKASNLATECEDAIEASSAIRSLANGWDCPDPWEAAIEKAEREARAEGRREGLREAAKTCDFFAKLWGERGDERGRDMQEGAARCNAHILALNEKERS